MLHYSYCSVLLRCAHNCHMYIGSASKYLRTSIRCTYVCSLKILCIYIYIYTYIIAYV